MEARLYFKLCTFACLAWAIEIAGWLEEEIGRPAI
jgi:hypothetical protein